LAIVVLQTSPVTIKLLNRNMNPKEILPISRYPDIPIRGFTLIELIVTTTIILILTGVGIAAYNNFNETQILKQAALDLKNNLRFAQTKALAGEKVCGPDFCGGADTDCGNEDDELPLSGWEVKFNADNYEIYGVCQDKTFNSKTYYYSNDQKIRVSPLPLDLRFKAAPLEVLNPGDICLSGFNKKYKLSVTLSGEIIDYGIVSTCP